MSQAKAKTENLNAFTSDSVDVTGLGEVCKIGARVC